MCLLFTRLQWFFFFAQKKNYQKLNGLCYTPEWLFWIVDYLDLCEIFKSSFFFLAESDAIEVYLLIWWRKKCSSFSSEILQRKYRELTIEKS